jgi:hypothetical protein
VHFHYDFDLRGMRFRVVNKRDTRLRVGNGVCLLSLQGRRLGVVYNGVLGVCLLMMHL